MKANELRIGNWVEHNSDWCYRGEDVYQFQWDTSDWYALGECTLFLENIEPIPLTEEWLIRFGFNLDLNSELYNKSGFDVELLTRGVEFYLGEYGSYFFYVEHVHQLQNLYFVLTGEELTLKS